MELTTIRHGQLTHLAQALVSHGFPRPPTRKTMEKYGVITPKGKRGGRLGYHMNSDKKRKSLILALYAVAALFDQQLLLR